MDGGFGLFAEADDEQAFGGKAGRCVQKEGFIRAGFVFAACEHGGCGGLDGGVGGEQRGLRLGVGPFGGLGVGGNDGQEFGLDGSERRAKKFRSS